MRSGWRARGVLAAALLLGGCGPGPAPDCAAPETVERLLVGAFNAMLELGTPQGGPRPEVDWDGRFIVVGPDTAFYGMQGDSLWVRERPNGRRELALVALSTRRIYEDARAGTWECEAAVGARAGMAIPIRYTSTRDAEGTHRVRGSLKGDEGEVVF